MPTPVLVPGPLSRPVSRVPAAAGALLSLLAGLSGCSEEGQSSGGGAGGSGGDTGVAQDLSVSFEGVTVAPGEEQTRCVIKKLPNDHALHFDRIETTLGPGSHHLILYRVTGTEEKPTPYDCEPFTDLLDTETSVPLMIAQQKKDGLELPPGIGIPLDAGQLVRIEMHYINTTSSPVEIQAKATFHEMVEADLMAEADFLFFSNADVKIPPLSEHTAGPQFLAVPPELDGVKFLSFTGHVHRLGTGFTIAAADGPDGPDTMVYDPEGFSWSEPPTVRHDPPVTLPPGGGFRFSCSWNNTTPNEITFGDSANDEMCLFWTYYHPSKGPIACAHSEIVGDFCCPSSPICAMLP
jgi:hypothetical protein